MGKSSKGSGFERQIAKELSLWWTKGERDDIFWRTSQSGGRATQRRKSKVSTANSAGDISYLDVIGKPLVDYFLIELKRGYSKNIDVLRIIDKKTKNDMVLLQWIDKAIKEMKESGKKEILLIVKRDRHDPFVVVSENLLKKLDELSGFYDKESLIINYDYTIVRYEEFFEYFTPATLKML